jgi:hypothetical protein
LQLCTFIEAQPNWRNISTLSGAVFLFLFLFPFSLSFIHSHVNIRTIYIDSGDGTRKREREKVVVSIPPVQQHVPRLPIKYMPCVSNIHMHIWNVILNICRSTVI